MITYPIRSAFKKPANDDLILVMTRCLNWQRNYMIRTGAQTGCFTGREKGAAADHPRLQKMLYPANYPGRQHDSVQSLALRFYRLIATTCRQTTPVEYLLSNQSGIRTTNPCAFLHSGGCASQSTSATSQAHCLA